MVPNVGIVYSFPELSIKQSDGLRPPLTYVLLYLCIIQP